ncbi:MAG TPA: DUF4142 domain-containing protein [Labilithrix sp.]|nr:DUF4142 domain-containing protein [Labilithrix sp.]
MKRSLLVIGFSPTLLALLLLAGSCTSGKPGGGPKKQVSTYDPNAQDGDGGSSSAQARDGGELAAGDAAELEPFKEIKNSAQALQVLITAYDMEIREGELGKTEGSTPPVKAFAADVVEEAKAGKARIRQAAANKSLTPASSLLTERMKFESQSSITHLKNIFQNMFNETWASRRIDAASNLLRVIDDELAPVLTDDDLKAELATTRKETERRMARAETLRNGLLDGPGNADGMFPEPEDPEPQPQPQQPAEDAGAEGAADEEAPPADPAALSRLRARR